MMFSYVKRDLSIFKTDPAVHTFHRYEVFSLGMSPWAGRVLPGSLKVFLHSFFQAE